MQRIDRSWVRAHGHRRAAAEKQQPGINRGVNLKDDALRMPYDQSQPEPGRSAALNFT